MASVGVAIRNATLDAPGFGVRQERCTILGYGKTFYANEGEGRRFKSFYPVVATSGTWFINLIFTSFHEKEGFNAWLAMYYSRVVDPYESPLMPMTVTVPSRNFRKVGYPVASAEFGDQFGQVTYQMMLQFKSASDPTLTRFYASKFKPPISDEAAKFFYPDGNLSNAEVGDFLNPDTSGGVLDEDVNPPPNNQPPSRAF